METKVVFQYNNISTPYLLTRIYEEDNKQSIGLINFEKDSLVNGLPDYGALVNGINEYLSAKNITKEKALFVINSDEMFKVTTIIPNINDKKTRKLYEVDFANKISNIGDYDDYSVSYVTDRNVIYYDYLLLKHYGNFFKQLGTDLGFVETNVDFYHNYVFEEIKNKVRMNTFAYIYEEKGIASLFVSVNGTLCGYASFEASPENYRLHIASIVEKHNLELEKGDITTLYTNKNIDCLKAVDPIVLNIAIGR